MLIKDQIAVVTGASRGLGRAISLELARAGARVALCARTASELDESVRQIHKEGGQAMRGVVDVSNYDSINAFLGEVRRRWGCVDILVNNAGVGWYKSLEEYSLEEIDAVLGVNLKGTVYMTKAVLPDMLARQHGQIVNVASDLSRKPLANMAVYAATKHGVLGFGASMARELKSKGIKVMTLNSGIIDTWFGDSQPGTREESWSLRPESVARIVCEMLSQPAYVLMDEVTVHPLHQDF